MNQQQPPGVQAAPNLYIDVVINGQKQIYDVQTATQLHDQLGNALRALTAPATAPETDPENPPPIQGDLLEQNADATPPDSSEASH